MPKPRLIQSVLEREQAQDLRRSVLCGELNWEREAVDDGWDESASVALAVDGERPVATGRLIHRAERWWVDLLAVLPQRRRQGLGRELIGFLTLLGREKSASGLWVLTPREAIPFFQACGFVEDGRDLGVGLLFLSLN